MKRSVVLIPVALSLGVAAVFGTLPAQLPSKHVTVAAHISAAPTSVKPVEFDDRSLREQMSRASRSRALPVKPKPAPKIVVKSVLRPKPIVAVRVHHHHHVMQQPVPTPVRHHHYAAVVVQHSAPAVSSRSTSSGCSSDWQASLGTDERWIYVRESGMDPTPSDVNPSSGARGLGQLLDSTYADLGITPDWAPCDEVAAARAYMRQRYGSWPNARAFWESHNWW